MTQPSEGEVLLAFLTYLWCPRSPDKKCCRASHAGILVHTLDLNHDMVCMDIMQYADARQAGLVA